MQYSFDHSLLFCKNRQHPPPVHKAFLYICQVSLLIQFAYDPGDPAAVGSLNSGLAACPRLEKLVVIGGIDASTLAVLPKLKNLKELIQVDRGFQKISIQKTKAILPGVDVQIMSEDLQHSKTPVDFLQHREETRKRLVDEYSRIAEIKK